MSKKVKRDFFHRAGFRLRLFFAVVPWLLFSEPMRGQFDPLGKRQEPSLRTPKSVQEVLFIYDQPEGTVQKVVSSPSTDGLRGTFRQFGEAPHFTQDEPAFILACQYFWDNLTRFFSTDSTARSAAFADIQARFQQFILSYPNSNLRDDAQLLIAIAASYLRDATLIRSEYEKLISNFSGDHFSHLHFTNSVVKRIIGWESYGTLDLYSSFVETDALARVYIAQLYSDPNQYPNVFNDSLTLDELTKVVKLYPRSIWTPWAQWRIGEIYNGRRLRYEAKSEFEKVFQLYAERSLWPIEAAFERIGSMMAAVSDTVVLSTYARLLKQKYRPDDYLAESRFHIGTNSRWRNRSNLTVSIQRSGGSLAGTDSSVILQALQSISSIARARVTFSLVPRSSDNNILIDFVAGGGGVASVSGVGFQGKYNEITRARIMLGVDRPTYEDRLKTALHEIGHALGLGHSFDRDDILFFSTQYVPRSALSPRDSTTINRLYPPSNEPPVILNSFYTPLMHAGTGMYLKVTNLDLNGDNLTYSLIGNPSWMNISPTSGEITGTPSLKDTGNYTVTVVVNDGEGGSDAKTWRFSVAPNPNVATSILQSTSPITSFELYQNYPNPFNPVTTIQYDLPEPSFVTLKVYDVMGREVAVLVNGYREAGRYSAVFNAELLPSGVYIYRLEAGKFVATKRLLLVK